MPVRSCVSVCVLLCLVVALGLSACGLSSVSQSQPPPLAVVNAPPAPPADGRSSRPPVTRVTATFPFYFEENRGQVDAAVQYLARGRGYSVLLSPTETVLALQQPMETARTLEGGGEKAKRGNGEKAEQLPVHSAEFAAEPRFAQFLSPIPRPLTSSSQPLALDPRPPAYLRMTLTGSSPPPQLTAEDPPPGTVKYFIGNDPTQWRTKIPTYGKVRSQNVYPGIDVTYYGRERELEYDFHVQPGADPQQIRMRFTGAEDLTLDPSGAVVLSVPGGEVRLLKPQIYQEIDGKKHAVQGTYRLTAEEEVGLVLAAYDTSKPLIIDPVLSYSTYLGVLFNREGEALAVDSQGNAYVAGTVAFPRVKPPNSCNLG
ncbi:MAG: SBBP repeat-containing protein [Candidatus Binatia bacterium]